MAKGNEWTVADIIKTMKRDRELHVHKKAESEKGFRATIKTMHESKMVKEVHENENYRFYQLTSLAKR